MKNKNLIIYQELGEVDLYDLESLLLTLQTNDQLNEILQKRLFFNVVGWFTENILDIMWSVKPESFPKIPNKKNKIKSKKKRKQINKSKNKKYWGLGWKLVFSGNGRELFEHINKIKEYSKKVWKKISLNIEMNNISFVINVENGGINQEEEKKIIYVLFDSNTRIKWNLWLKDADKFYEKLKKDIINNDKWPLEISPYAFMADKECSYDYVKNENDQKNIDKIYKKRALEIADPIVDKKLVETFFNLSIKYFDDINKIIRDNFDKDVNSIRNLNTIKDEIIKKNLSSKENIEKIFNDKFFIKLIEEHGKYKWLDIKKKIWFIDFRMVLGSFIRNIFTYDKSVLISKDEDFSVIWKLICYEIIPRFLAERMLIIEKNNAKKVNTKSREYFYDKFKEGYNTVEYRKNVLSELRIMTMDLYENQKKTTKKNALFIINMEKENSRFLNINLDQNILDICIIEDEKLEELTKEIGNRIKNQL